MRKDTKTFWIQDQDQRYENGSRRYENLLDRKIPSIRPPAAGAHGAKRKKYKYLSRRSMNHDAMTKFSASVATAASASASASATASAAPAWTNASSVSKNRPVSVEDYRGSSSSSTAPPPQSTIRGGTGMDELLAPVSTLDEPVMETIMRDVRAVGAKLRAVLIPLDRHVSV